VNDCGELLHRLDGNVLLRRPDELSGLVLFNSSMVVDGGCGWLTHLHFFEFFRPESSNHHGFQSSGQVFGENDGVGTQQSHEVGLARAGENSLPQGGRIEDLVGVDVAEDFRHGVLPSEEEALELGAATTENSLWLDWLEDDLESDPVRQVANNKAAGRQQPILVVKPPENHLAHAK